MKYCKRLVFFFSVILFWLFTLVSGNLYAQLTYITCNSSCPGKLVGHVTFANKSGATTGRWTVDDLAYGGLTNESFTIRDPAAYTSTNGDLTSTGGGTYTIVSNPSSVNGPTGTPLVNKVTDGVLLFRPNDNANAFAVYKISGLQQKGNYCVRVKMRNAAKYVDCNQSLYTTIQFRSLSGLDISGGGVNGGTWTRVENNPSCNQTTTGSWDGNNQTYGLMWDEYASWYECNFQIGQNGNNANDDGFCLYFRPNSWGNNDVWGIDEIEVYGCITQQIYSANGNNICQGTPTTLTAQGIGSTTDTYSWKQSTDGGTTWTPITSSTANTLDVTPAAATLYSVTCSRTGLTVTNTITPVNCCGPTGLFTIPKVCETITVDGTDTEPVWYAAPWVTVDGTKGLPLVGAQDCGTNGVQEAPAAKWKSVYDKTNIYFFVQVFDDNPANTISPYYWMDGVEIYLKDASGNPKQFGAGYSATSSKGYGNLSGVTHKIVKSASTWEVEIAIPLTANNIDVTQGFLGLEVGINQSKDGTTCRAAQLFTWIAANHYSSASQYHIAPLSDCAGVHASTQTVCNGGSSVLTTQLSTVNAGLNYAWQQSTDGGTTWNNITGITNTITVAPTVQTQYRAIYDNVHSCPVTISQGTINLTVNNPAAVCSPATVDLTAASVTTGSQTGLNFSYYTDAAATSALSTPGAVTTSGTYYIKGQSSSCFGVKPVTVVVNPAAVISGTLSACVNATTTLSASITGGTWSSGTTTVATVDPATGVVTGVAGGTSVITYTAPSGCKTTATVTINALPSISGTLSACVNATTTLSASITGGTWSSSTTTVATVDPATGVITGVAGGTSVVTYTTSSGCKATATVTINALPSISGTLSACVNATTTLSASITGGTWSSGTTTVATVDPATGVVTGVAGGTSVVTYTTSSGCKATATVTINALPSISGTLTVTVGTSSNLSASISGGTWYSASTTIATIDASTGVVTGVAGGTSVITYTTASGCNATATVTVSAIPNISGTLSTCVNSTSTLTANISGGTWSSSSTSIATVNASTGIVTGIAAGTSDITYTLGGNSKTVSFTVNPLPAISGTLSACVNATTTLSASISGGTWFSGTTTVATIDPNTGVVNGVASGTSVITYTAPTTGCTVTAIVTVNALPVISGTLSACVNATTTLSASISGGTWSSATTTVATINASTGIVTGVSSGTSLITYTTASGCKASATVTINALPVISGTLTACVNATTTLSASISGGTWSSATTSVATINASSGTVTGASGGSSIITYTTSSGCTDQATVTINPLPTATISGSGSACQNTASPNITFTGANGTSPYTFTYTINNGAPLTVTTTSGNSTTVAVPTSTTGTFVYALTNVKDASTTTCENAISGQTATVVVNVLPTGTISGTANVCQNTSAPGITFTATNGTAPYTFTYTINGGAPLTVTTTSSNSATISAPTNSAGTFVYALTNVKDASTTTCNSTISGQTATITIGNIPATPTASVTIQPSCTSPDGTIVISAPTGASIEYSKDGTFFQPGTTFSSLAPGTTYSLTARNSATGCVSAAKSIAVNSLPAPPATPVALISTPPSCLVPTGTITISSPTGSDILYSIDGTNYQGNKIYSGLTPNTNYAITAKDNLTGCTSGALNITMSPLPDNPFVNAGRDKELLLGQSVKLDGVATGDGIKFVWSPTISMTGAGTLTPTVSPLSDQIYTLTVTSKYGCTASDEVKVFVVKEIIVPNAFSPNGDGLNDTWVITNLEDYPQAEVSVFNRYGQMIFEASHGSYASQPWDGKYKGTPVPEGTYYWIIKLSSDKKPISGSIAVIR